MIVPREIETSHNNNNNHHHRTNQTQCNPSQFSALLLTEISSSIPVVEFGCGSSGDSLFLSNYGFYVHSSDKSKEIITSMRNNYNIYNVPAEDNDGNLRPSFSVCDCTNVTEVKKLVRNTRAGSSRRNIVVYNRFLLHSLDETEEKLFIHALQQSLISGDRVFFEFRCSMDELLPCSSSNKADDIKRYVYTPDLVEYLNEEGFFVEYEQTGRGVAKYRNDDPFVSRIIVRRR